MTSEKDSEVNGEPFPSRDETVRMGEERLAQHRDDAVRTTTFKPGQLVGERYRIIRLVATGGMGEVYEADDLDLSERVALKTLRAGSFPSQVTQKRFRREIQLARKVTHPSVCRVHDAFTHVAKLPDGRSFDELTCVTMEFLEGETLARKLEREGALPLDEALSIVRQMSDGLAAAHDAGIIHRDFKPGNVMLAARPDGGTRAVITDFGLARKAETDIDPTLTETGMVVGTPAYMPPEQLEGKFITTAADIYALGVVIYEMVTGKRPFPGQTPMSLAVQRLNTLPVSPAIHKAGLPRVWEATILRCLEPHPEARFESARDVVAALEKKRVARGKGPRRNRTLLRRRVERVALVGLFAVALVAGMGGVRSLLKERSSVPATTQVINETVEVRRAAAVFGLKNLSGGDESAWLSTALAEMLRTEMAAGEQIRLVSGEDIARAKVELALPDADAFSPDTLRRLRENVGAAVVLVGSYVVVPNGEASNLRVDVRLQDTDTGETVLAVERSGAESELLSLVADLGSELRERLGTGVLSESQNRALAASRPSNNEALRLYSEGLDALRSYDALAAKELLERAVALDTEFPLAHAALADAWSTLGYDAKAAQEAGKAFQLSEGLRREEKMLIEARFHEANADWPKAAEVYSALHRFFPDDLDYGLKLAAVQTSNAEYEEAERVIAALRELPPPAVLDPRIDLAEAALYRAQGGFEKIVTAAERAVMKGEVRNARVLVARAKLDLGWAYRELSRFDEAVEVLTDARSTLAGYGDKGGAAEADLLIGSTFVYAGEKDEASRRFEAVLDACREVGWKKCEAHAMSGVATSYYLKGQIPESVEWFEEAVETSRETGDNVYAATMLVNQSQMSILLGDTGKGREIAEEVLQEVDRTGQGYLRYVGEFCMAMAFASEGKLSDAEHHAELGVAASRESGSRRHEAMSLTILGDVAVLRGDFEMASREFRSALSIQEATHEIATAEETRVRLAELALLSGRGGEHLEEVKRAVETLKVNGTGHSALEAERVLVEILLERGDVGRARELIDAVVQRSSDVDVVRTALMIRIAEAKVSAAEGRREVAVRSLRTAAADARAMGLLPLEYFADVAELRIRLKDPGRWPDARDSVAALIERADVDGFGFVRKSLEGRTPHDVP